MTTLLRRHQNPAQHSFGSNIRQNRAVKLSLLAIPGRDKQELRHVSKVCLLLCARTERCGSSEGEMNTPHRLRMSGRLPERGNMGPGS